MLYRFLSFIYFIFYMSSKAAKLYLVVYMNTIILSSSSSLLAVCADGDGTTYHTQSIYYIHMGTYTYTIVYYE